MKTATTPSLRVDPEPRRSAESVLREGESLSGFVDQAIRQAQQAFIARGLIARNQVRHMTSYVEASAVVDRLQDMLDKAKSGKLSAGLQ